jgi:hypothetical protein
MMASFNSKVKELKSEVIVNISLEHRLDRSSNWA